MSPESAFVSALTVKHQAHHRVRSLTRLTPDEQDVFLGLPRVLAQ